MQETLEELLQKFLDEIPAKISGWVLAWNGEGISTDILFLKESMEKELVPRKIWVFFWKLMKKSQENFVEEFPEKNKCEGIFEGMHVSNF